MNYFIIYFILFQVFYFSIVIENQYAGLFHFDSVPKNISIS